MNFGFMYVPSRFTNKTMLFICVFAKMKTMIGKMCNVLTLEQE